MVFTLTSHLVTIGCYCSLYESWILKLRFVGFVYFPSSFVSPPVKCLLSHNVLIYKKQGGGYVKHGRMRWMW